MDYLLGFYILLFIGILIAPYLFFFFKFQNEESPFGSDLPEQKIALLSSQRSQLEALKELRSDFHSKKISESEFQETSLPLLKNLEQLEKNLSEFQVETSIQTLKPISSPPHFTCQNCGFSVTTPNARFCSQCGTSLLA